MLVIEKIKNPQVYGPRCESSDVVDIQTPSFISSTIFVTVNEFFFKFFLFLIFFFFKRSYAPGLHATYICQHATQLSFLQTVFLLMIIDINKKINECSFKKPYRIILSKSPSQ